MRLPNAIFAPMLGLLFAAALLACTMVKTQAPGEVVVVVTSDMVVPDDIDTLTWSVTIGDAGAPFKDGSVSLTSSTFPATLAIVSGHETPGPVTIRLEGLLGPTVRVHREAELLTVPDDGKVRQVVVPLNWLCTHDANPLLSCEAGDTCQAGECVSAAMALEVYSPPEGACFNVSTCFAQLVGGGGAVTLPAVDSTGNCTTTNTNQTGVDVNVALVVDTSQIGNYGACGIDGLCLIPLSSGAPEGWTTFTDDSGAPMISLPPAVCAELGTTVNGVLLAQASSSCPPKLLESPTCPPADTCIQSATCPHDWGSGWAGSSCSGSKTPRGGLVQWCWPPAATDAGSDTEDGGANGRWCCLVGTTERPPGSDPLLIDDMTGGPQIKITPPSDEIAGFWYTASDGNSLLPGSNSLFTYEPAPPPVPVSLSPDAGSMNAACLTSPAGFNGYYAQEGFNFAMQKGAQASGGVPFDVSPYTGIRFLAWSRYDGQSIRVQFPDIDTEATYAMAPCQPSNCGDDFGTQRTLTNTWGEYSVTWKELAQLPGGGLIVQSFDTMNVFASIFGVVGNGPDSYYPPFEFCVSQIYFTIPEPGADGGVDAGGDATMDGGGDAAVE